MKRISILIAIILVLSSCTVARAPDSMKSEDAVLVSPLVIGEGAACPPYTPQGQVIYESGWTGEYPEVEKYDKAYATATFGMG